MAGRVESVPSEQLWRAAILAARQAAVAAAELRRALEQGAPPAIVSLPNVPPVVGTDSAASELLVS